MPSFHLGKGPLHGLKSCCRAIQFADFKILQYNLLERCPHSGRTFLVLQVAATIFELHSTSPLRNSVMYMCKGKMFITYSTLNVTMHQIVCIFTQRSTITVLNELCCK